MQQNRLSRIHDSFGTEPIELCRALHRAGHDAVIVGGPVRDALLGQRSNDVDIATSALPSQVRKLFPRTYVQGKGEHHGTIGVIGESGATYEVTTFRRDIETDGRHARVRFTKSLEEDLARRDFTINAIALRPDQEKDFGKLIDPFGGIDDLRNGVIRAVGDPKERFREDYLRILRAIRFAGRFNFVIESNTWAVMLNQEEGLATLARERARDELLKLGAQATIPSTIVTALRQFREVGFFRVFIPEIAACEGVTQNEYHAYTVDEHLFHVAEAAAFHRPGDGRFFLAALLHDIGKPVTRSIDEKGRVRFLGHEKVGAELAKQCLGANGLALSATDQKWIIALIAHHMDLLHRRIETITPKQVRELWRQLKEEGAGLDPLDLGDIRYCDKQGAGIEDSRILRETLERYRAIVEEVRSEAAALQVTDLAIDGRIVMERLGLTRGSPIVGEILHQLLNIVVEQPALNTKEHLIRLTDKLGIKLRKPSPKRVRR